MEDINNICWLGGSEFAYWVQKIQNTYNIKINVYGHKRHNYYYLDNPLGFDHNPNPRNFRTNRILQVITFDEFLLYYAENIKTILLAEKYKNNFYSII